MLAHPALQPMLLQLSRTTVSCIAANMLGQCWARLNSTMAVAALPVQALICACKRTSIAAANAALFGKCQVALLHSSR
jgi:hypothetical protein